jgi:conjugal transfer ATP-binding protein TraC
VAIPFMPALAPSEEADLDAALIETYAKAGITNDPLTHTGAPPTIADLYDTLLHMGGTGPQLAQRLRKYTSGTFAGIFSQQQHRYQQSAGGLQPARSWKTNCGR